MQRRQCRHSIRLMLCGKTPVPMPITQVQTYMYTNEHISTTGGFALLDTPKILLRIWWFAIRYEWQEGRERRRRMGMVTNTSKYVHVSQYNNFWMWTITGVLGLYLIINVESSRNRHFYHQKPYKYCRLIDGKGKMSGP